MVLKGGKYEPRIRKRKTRERGTRDTEEHDPNALIGADGKKVTGKKAKRLAKYLDQKLKKDENKALKEKLAKNVVDTSLFVSSKMLGQTKLTKRQQMSYAINEENEGILREEPQGLLRKMRQKKQWGDQNLRHKNREEENITQSQNPILATQLPSQTLDSESEAESKSDSPPSPSGSQKYTLEVAATTFEREPNPQCFTPIAGSGLKRPLDLGEDGRPIIPKRQKLGGVASKFSVHEFLQNHHGKHEQNWEGEDSSWEGLSDRDGSVDIDSNGPCGSKDNIETEDSEEPNESEDGANGADDDDDNETEDSENESPDEDSILTDLEARKNARKARSTAFIEWAHQSRNDALGYQPWDGTTNQLDIARPENFKPRPVEEEPLPSDLQPTKNDDRKAFSVAIQRSPKIQESRLNLPVVSEEQRIMEAIHNNNTVVICGSTGSGKTTQIPQFLYEAGYGSPESPTPGMIGITQPRRVATVSMARRVADEMGNKKDVVAYQIRFQSNVKDQTAIKFMTDGILLRELSKDAFLKKYSAIIVDEAHERSLNSDILLGLLSELVRYRGKPKHGLPPLKLIIMSATLRMTDLTENPRLFKKPPPVLDVEGKQYPVAIHFAGKTEHDYVAETFKKIKKGHRKLPPGGMLVFLTGQSEIHRLQKMLKDEFGGHTVSKPPIATLASTEYGLEAEDVDFGNSHDYMEANESSGIDDYEEDEEDEEDDAQFDIGEEEGQESGPGPLKMHILPLYSMLPVTEQDKVFQKPPTNTRLVVLATNIAETSITIPGIRYVFDCGRSKERRFHKNTGVQSFDIDWISKASAAQRAGRAGRTGPGHCYRLYSSAIYERDFAEFADPEILRVPIEGVVLELKSRGRTHVERFPFPTPPETAAILKAEKILRCLQAIDKDGRSTMIGDSMSTVPVAPRFARILLAKNTENCLPFAIAIVAGLSVSGEIFMPENQVFPPDSDTSTGSIGDKERRDKKRREYGAVQAKFTHFGQTDMMKLLHAVMEFSHTPTEDWCRRHYVHKKSLSEARMLRQQLTNLLVANIPGHNNLVWADKMEPPNEKQRQIVTQMLCAGFVDQVAIRADVHPNPPDVARASRAIDVAYIPLAPIHPAGTGKLVGDEDKCIYIHPSSPLSRLSARECPEYIVYRQLQQPSNSATGGSGNKTRMLPLTDIGARALGLLARDTPLLTWGKPIKELSNDGKTREAWIAPEMRIPGAVVAAWPLPPMKVRQCRDIETGRWMTMSLAEEKRSS